MADLTDKYNLTYPEATDPVNVHGDIKKLADDVDSAISSLDVSNLRVKVVNSSLVTLNAGSPVCVNNPGSLNNRTTVGPFTSEMSDDKPLLGLTKTTLNPGQEGEVVVAGVLENVNTSGFSVGSLLYVSSAGSLTTTQNGGVVGIVAVSNATSGVIVIQAKGNGTWGALKAGLA